MLAMPQARLSGTLGRTARLAGGPAMFGIVQVMLAAIVWSTTGVATQLVSTAQAVPEGAFGVGRMLVGGPAILFLLLCTEPRQLMRIGRMNPRLLAEFAIGCGLFQMCMFKSFILLGVTPTVFMTVCLPPLIGTLWELLVRPQSQSRGACVALAIACLGLLIVAGWGQATEAHANVTGLLLVILGSVGFVVMTSAARRLAQHEGAILVTGIGLCLTGLVLLAYETAIGGQALSTLRGMDWRLAGLILYLGLVPTAMAYGLYCAGIAQCRSANIGMIASMFEPALAAILARMLLGEILTPGQIIGCAFVMVAMITLWKSERRTAG